MKKLLLALTLLSASSAFAQNADRIVDGSVMALTNTKEESLYIIHALQFSKGANGEISNVEEKNIICKANQDCLLSLTKEIGYPVSVSYTDGHKPPLQHDTKKTSDNIKINIHPENDVLTLQYVNKATEINDMGTISVRSNNDTIAQFNLNEKITNITYVLGQTFAYQDIENTELNINPLSFKEPQIDKKYITLSIQKYAQKL